MKIHRCSFNERLVAFLGVLSCRISEESAAKCLPNFLCVATARDNRVFVSFHYFHELITDILCPTHGACLDEIFKTPRVGKFVLFPAVVNIEEGEMIAMRIMKLGFLLVGLCLLLFWAVEG